MTAIRTPLGNIEFDTDEIIDIIAMALIRAEYDNEFRKIEFARIEGREDGVSIVDDDSSLVPGPSGTDAAVTNTDKILVERNRVKGWKRKVIGIQNTDAAIDLLCGYAKGSTRWVVKGQEAIEIPLPDDTVLWVKASAAGPITVNWWEFGNGLPGGVKS